MRAQLPEDDEDDWPRDRSEKPRTKTRRLIDQAAQSLEAALSGEDRRALDRIFDKAQTEIRAERAREQRARQRTGKRDRTLPKSTE